MSSVYYYAHLAFDKILRRNSASTESVASRRLSDNSCCVTPEATFSDFNSFQMGAIPRLPDELLDLIMDNLDLDSLKQCRQVCWKWDQVISSKKSFLDKLCLCHVESFVGSPENGVDMTAYVQQNGRLPLGLNALRLRNFYSFWKPLPPKFFSWIKSMSGITWLEIQSSQLKMSHLLEILGELPNVTTLRITGDTLIHNPGVNDLAGSGENSLNHLQRIQHLILHFEDLHNFLISLDRQNLIHIPKLETLDLKGNAGNTTNVFRIGGVLQKLLSQTSSLKVFRLDNFESSVRGWLDTKLASSKYQLRSSLYAEFPRFLSSLGWAEIPNLEHLQEISFDRFPIANMNDPSVESRLVPLFMNAKNLRKLTISQVYFSDDVHFEKFVSLIPSMVWISMTSVHLNAPSPNQENITEVLHCEQNILKYQAAAVRLEFLNLDWRIIYLTWSSLGQSSIMQKYAHLLRKLELSRVNFSIGDNEMQFIIREAKLLEELGFDFCDLSGMTDSGVTGLSSVAVNRFWADDGYEPLETDFVGTPVQRLSGLRSIKLTNVGAHISHISVLRSFLPMTQLRVLTIHQNPLIIRPNALDRMKNRGNILVEYRKPNQ